MNRVVHERVGESWRGDPLPSPNVGFVHLTATKCGREVSTFLATFKLSRVTCDDCKSRPGSIEKLTFPQRRALGELTRATTRRSAKSIFTRSDVLWRLEEKGYVGRGVGDQWYIRPAGREAYEAAMADLEHQP